MANELRGQSIGLYLHGETLIAVACQPTPRHGVRISARAATTLPRGSVTALTADPLVLGQAIRKLVRQLDVRATEVSVALPVPADSMRALRLPDVPVVERRTLVRGELEELTVLPSGGGAFDFLWTSLVAEGGRRQAEVSAYVLQDSQVDALREALRIAGLQLAAIEPASIAALRAYRQVVPRQPEALLHVAENHADLCLVDADRVRLLRRIPAGWSEFTRHLDTVAGALEGANVDRELPAETPGGIAPDIFIPPPLDPTARQASAEAAMSLPDIPGLEPLFPEPAAPPPPPPSVVGDTPPSFLALEVARTLAFYARDYPDAPGPEQLTLLAPEPMRAHIDEFARSLDLPVAFSTALDRFEAPPPHTERGIAPDPLDFLSAAGVALPGNEETVAKLDISRQEKAAISRRRAPVVLMFGMAGSTMWMLLAAAAAVALAVLEPKAIDQKIALTEEISRIRQERAPLLRWQEVSDAAQGMRAKSQIPAPAVMGRLAATVTPGVEVKKLEVRPDGRVAVEGVALSARSVQSFVQRLGIGRSVRSPFFEMMRQEKDGTLAFRIVGNFRGEKEGA